MIGIRRSVFAVAVGCAAALALLGAAPAHADQATYLSTVQPRFVFLTTDQLLSEGYKVCAAHSNGMMASDAYTMVQDDLGVTVPVSIEIVSAAVVHLDC